jgi:hypothetical protein
MAAHSTEPKTGPGRGANTVIVMAESPLLDRIAAQDGAVWLLVIVAALFPTELGTSHVADSTVASIVAALLAAAAATLVVLAARERAETLLVTAALCTAGAATIHFAVTQTHFDEWWGFGIFFFASGWVQLLWAALAVRVRSRPLLAIGLAGNAFVVGLWVVTRTVGVPFGPEPGEAESLGWADAIATGFEAVAALCCLVLLVRPLVAARLRVSPFPLGAVAAALTVIGLLEAVSGHGH